MAVNKSLITKTTEHHLEDVFDIEPGTTIIQREEQTTELVAHESYDAKDDEIESDIQTILDKSLSGYERLQDELDGVEGKYIARIAEVSAQYLNMGLNAIKEKARLKEHKDKLVAKQKAPPTTVNQNLVISQMDLLNMLRKDSKDESE